MECFAASLVSTAGAAAGLALLSFAPGLPGAGGGSWPVGAAIRSLLAMSGGVSPLQAGAGAPVGGGRPGVPQCEKKGCPPPCFQGGEGQPAAVNLLWEAGVV